MDIELIRCIANDVYSTTNVFTNAKEIEHFLYNYRVEEDMDRSVIFQKLIDFLGNDIGYTDDELIEWQTTSDSLDIAVDYIIEYLNLWLEDLPSDYTQNEDITYNDIEF